jgi:hypothetical protein
MHTSGFVRLLFILQAILAVSRAWGLRRLSLCVTPTSGAMHSSALDDTAEMIVIRGTSVSDRHHEMQALAFWQCRASRAVCKMNMPASGLECSRMQSQMCGDPGLPCLSDLEGLTVEMKTAGRSKALHNLIEVSSVGIVAGCHSCSVQPWLLSSDDCVAEMSSSECWSLQALACCSRLTWLQLADDRHTYWQHVAPNETPLRAPCAEALKALKISVLCMRTMAHTICSSNHNICVSATVPAAQERCGLMFCSRLALRSGYFSLHEHAGL